MLQFVVKRSASSYFLINSDWLQLWQDKTWPFCQRASPDKGVLTSDITPNGKQRDSQRSMSQNMRFSLITELPNYKEEPYINIPLIYDTMWRVLKTTFCPSIFRTSMGSLFWKLYCSKGLSTVARFILPPFDESDRVTARECVVRWLGRCPTVNCKLLVRERGHLEWLAVKTT